MKIILAAALSLTVLFPIAVSAKSVQVTLPDFQVTINGQLMDNTYNQYPLLVYKGITYFPMAYEYARFMGLKAHYYEKRGNIAKPVLFVGVSDNPTTELKVYKTETKNRKSYTAVIAEYDLALNTVQYSHFLNNKTEPYPILNFRDISYFPLTWRFTADEFGWNYTFDTENGLFIDSSDPFRPIIRDSLIANSLPTAHSPRYFYSDNYYVGYNATSLDNDRHWEFIVRKRGGEEKIFNLKEQLEPADYYFGSNVFGEEISSIEGNIFTIYYHHNLTDPGGFISLDLDTGLVLSQTKLLVTR